MIKDNPFYILNIPMDASKAVMAAASEAALLRSDRENADDSLAALLNPEKRLAAELDWFPGEDEKTIRSVKEALIAGRALPADIEWKLSGIGTVNALVCRLETALKDVSAVSTYTAADNIKTIGRLIESLDRDELLAAVNSARREAGITEASAEQLAGALQHKLGRTADELNDCIRLLPEEACLSLMNNLAKHYSGAAKHDESADHDGAQLFCMLADRFGTDTMQARTGLTEKLYAAIDGIVNHSWMLDIGWRMKHYYRTLDRWSRYNRPLQTAAALHGASQEESLDVIKKSLGMITRIVKKDDPVSCYEFLGTLSETFDTVPEAEKLIAPYRSKVGELITRLTRKTPEEAVWSRRRGKASTKAGNIIFLILLGIIGLLALLSPTDEEQAYDPSTSYYREIRQPYSVNHQGEFEEVSMPPTGFAFQDTMGEDDSVSTLHINGQTDRAMVLRISDQQYGNGTYIYLPGETMADSDKLPAEYAEEALRAVLSQAGDEEGASEERASGDEEGAAEEHASGGDPGVPADARILTIMIREGEQTDIRIPPGEYYVSYDCGFMWYGWRFRFTRQFNNGSVNPAEYDFPVMEPAFDGPIAVEADTEYTLNVPGGLEEIPNK